MPLQGRIILIDSIERVSSDCRKALEKAGFHITRAGSSEQGIEKVRHESFDVALLGLETPGISGIKHLKQLKQNSPNTAVIVLTLGAAGMETDEAIRNGALDCVQEPFTPGILVEAVSAAARHTRRALEDSCIGLQLERMMISQVLIGRSEPMSRVGRFVEKAAAVDGPVLITGESGTGKNVVARAIHRLSRRSNRRYITVDCRKSDESLLQRELFGPDRGAISDAVGNIPGKVELADGGTLFLDEFINIGSSVQEKLLGVILEGKLPTGENTSAEKPDKRINIRIISATSRDLTREMGEGNFREDLFYRLNNIHIPMPPLRERLEDIPLLADYYIRRLSAENKRPARSVPSISDEALRSLKRRDWPGNVRELIDVLEHAVANCKDNTIESHHLPPEPISPAEPDGEPGGHLARMEKNEILRILEQFQGNKTQAANYLGINRKTLREKMERYGISNR